MKFDVVVIGGGHAGCEAATAAARSARRRRSSPIASPPLARCRAIPPSAGLGKGHLVREIDALDGVMGRAADAAGIQFRVLNRRKGPPSRGRAPRPTASSIGAPCRPLSARLEPDRGRRGSGPDRVRSRRRYGRRTCGGRTIACPAVVLTTGTFLRGMIHLGDQRTRPGASAIRPRFRWP